VLAPTVIRLFLHTTPTPKGVGEGLSGLLQPSAIAVYWSDQLVSLGRDGRHRTTHSRWLGPGKPLDEAKAAADEIASPRPGQCSMARSLA